MQFIHLSPETVKTPCCLLCSHGRRRLHPTLVSWDCSCILHDGSRSVSLCLSSWWAHQVL